MADDDTVAWETELEHRASVPSLEKLHHDRRELLKRHAKLLALYGSFGLYDDRRKQLVEAMKVKARMDLDQSGERATDARVESEAYGSAEYQTFLDQSLDDKITYLKVQNRLSEIQEQIRNREIALLAYNSEIKLAR